MGMKDMTTLLSRELHILCYRVPDEASDRAGILEELSFFKEAMQLLESV
ncbi:hypothetical protein Holit_01697 [Hollandina sp. SP2]